MSRRFLEFVGLDKKTRYIFPGAHSKDAEYKLAQSGDATCNGLDSAEV